MSAVRVERIGAATLFLGNCLEALADLQRPATIISDPPYGQAHKTNIFNAGGGTGYRCGAIGGGERVMRANLRKRNGVFNGSVGAQVWPEGIHGDDAPFDPAPWLSAAPIVVLWGAHKFADRLPPGGWLVWDKVPTGKVRDQGDGEAAWINRDMPMRIFRLLWDGVCVGSAARHEVTAGQSRVHPTQKPVALMSWCIAQARVPAGGVIVDPYMGAGSTGIAAVQAGHPFVGCEIEPRYFDTACRRIEAAQRQAELFPPPATPDLERAMDAPMRSLFA